MKKGRIDLKFDIKAMGFIFYVPFFIIALVTLYMYYLSQSFIELKLALPTLEFIVVPFSCWWTLYLYSDYYEREGGELLFSYPLTTHQHGFLRVFSMFLIYSLISLPPIYSVSLSAELPIELLLLQYIPQFFFFSGFGFLLMTTFRNIGIVIMIIGFYVSTEFLTHGALIPWYHVFYFNDQLLDFYSIINKSILNVMIGFVFIYIGGRYLRSIRS